MAQEFVLSGLIYLCIAQVESQETTPLTTTCLLWLSRQTASFLTSAAIRHAKIGRLLLFGSRSDGLKHLQSPEVFEVNMFCQLLQRWVRALGYFKLDSNGRQAPRACLDPVNGVAHDAHV